MKICFQNGQNFIQYFNLNIHFKLAENMVHNTEVDIGGQGGQCPFVYALLLLKF